MIEHTVKTILMQVLGIDDRGNTLTPDSQLLGSVPEFDSMAVVSVLTALEDEFGFMVDDDEVSAETFETVGTLVQFVENKIKS